MTICQLLEAARHKLAHLDRSRLEAEILLGHALEVKRSFLYANPDFVVPAKRGSEFRRLVKCRSEGHPIAYLTGKRAFWTLGLHVSPAVLIPRPETELLVEAALELVPVDAKYRIADLGTGSGAIALAIAHERPNCEVHASDCSEAALRIARKNARLNNLDHVRFHRGNWTEPLLGEFNLIVSNPPYIREQDPHLQQGDCRFEPAMALTPGGDGLDAIRCIVETSPAWLMQEGWLILEHGYDQAESVRKLLNKNGFSEVRTIRDLAGIERLSLGKKAGNQNGPASR